MIKGMVTLGAVFAPLGLTALLGCGAESSRDDSTFTGEPGVSRNEFAQVVKWRSAETGEEIAAPPPSIAVSCTHSYGDSCEFGVNEVDVNGVCTGVSAQGCRRRDGSLTDWVSWSGRCFTDIANDDGNLVCR